MDWISQLDLWAAESAHGLLSACGGWLTPVLKVITLSGNGGAIFLALSLLFLIFRRTRKLGATGLIALAVGAVLTNLLLKNLVARPRPFADPDSVFFTFWTEAGSLEEGGWSFPSGHTTAAMAFATALFLRENKKISWLAFLIPLLMGFTRIYFGVHFATDVLAGLLVGAVGGAAAFYILKGLTRFRPLRTFLDGERSGSATEGSSGTE